MCASSLRPNAAVVTGRRSPNMLYAETARVLRGRRDVPPRGCGGLRQDRVARGRARGRPQAGDDERMTLWCGPGRARARPGRGRVPPRRRRRAAAVRLRGDGRARPPLHAAGLLDDDELAEAESRLRGDRDGRRDRARGRGRPHRDRAAARRRRAGRSTPGRSRNDQVAAAFRLYVADASRRGAGRDRRARRRRCSTAPRPRRRRRCRATPTCSGLSRSRSATTCSRGSRCSSAT